MGCEWVHEIKNFVAHVQFALQAGGWLFLLNLALAWVKEYISVISKEGSDTILSTSVYATADPLNTKDIDVHARAHDFSFNLHEASKY